MKISIKKLGQSATVFLPLLLNACVGGSGESSGGGGNPIPSNISAVYDLSSVLSPSVHPNCLFRKSDNVVDIIKTDGSGNGFEVNTLTGNVSQVSNLPAINTSAGDICLPNFDQLNWYNNSNNSLINVYDPITKDTKQFNLSHSGASVSTLSYSSFVYNNTANLLYVNNTFNADGYVGFARFSGTNPTSFSALDNSSYHRLAAGSTPYGFSGDAQSFTQLYNASNNLPAILVDVMTGTDQQFVSLITDNSGNPLPGTNTSMGFVSYGNVTAIVTAALNPVIYVCSNNAQYNLTCNNAYTVNMLGFQRLLGGNNDNLYFIGSDLASGRIKLFSLALHG